MSEQNKNGGAAFPTLTYDHGAAMNGIGVSVTDHPGMTLRDYFAAKVLPAIYRDFFDDVRAFRATVPEDWEMSIARDAYKLADAMLKAREDARVLRLGNERLAEALRDAAPAAPAAPQPAQQPLTDEHKAILRECRDQAMRWTLDARIPEAGAFSGIAQDLDYLCAQLGVKND